MTLRRSQFKQVPLAERDFAACRDLSAYGLSKPACLVDHTSRRFALRRKSFPAERTCIDTLRSPVSPSRGAKEQLLSKCEKKSTHPDRTIAGCRSHSLNHRNVMHGRPLFIAVRMDPKTASSAQSPRRSSARPESGPSDARAGRIQVRPPVRGYSDDTVRTMCVLTHQPARDSVRFPRNIEETGR